ncbi:AI-2E family transporter [Arsenicicoccus dermatophilus]|uniref:AI-2E family transporter n=1 Tax=Arsenicicoccus dermatophilus TaxID=1076331 RepID=UPI003916D370
MDARPADPADPAEPLALSTPTTAAEGAGATRLTPAEGAGATRLTPAEARELVHQASLERADRVARQLDEDDGDTTRGRGAMPRMLVILVGCAAGFIALQGMTAYQSLIAPAFLALNFMIAAYPLKSALTRRNVPEWLASIVMGLVVFAAVILFFWAMGWAAVSLVNEIPQYASKFQVYYDTSLEELSKLGLDQAKLEKQLQGVDPQSVMGYVTTLLNSLQSVTGLLAVVVMMLFFLMMDAAGWGARMDVARRHHPRVVDALDAFGGGVRRYWLVSSFFGLIVAVLNWGALLYLGIPLAAVWAVLSFLTNYIPNIGFVIGLVPPALMALLAKGPVTALYVVIAYCVLNFVVQSIIQPKFAGDAIGVTPTLAFVSLLFWAAVLGPMGAILALPMTLLLKAILIDADPRARWVNAFLAADHKTAETPSVKDTVDPDGDHPDSVA